MICYLTQFQITTMCFLLCLSYNTNKKSVSRGEFNLFYWS